MREIKSSLGMFKPPLKGNNRITALIILTILAALLIIVHFFSVSYAEELQGDIEIQSEPIKIEGQSTYGIESIKILSSIPEPPSLQESQVNSSFQPTTTYLTAPGDQVDTNSGVLIISQTDIKLPGMNGLDLEISRNYSSRMFRTNPKWNVSQNPDALTWHYSFPVSYFWPVFPECWGGWMGKGWQFNLFGRLFFNDYDYEIKDYGSGDRKISLPRYPKGFVVQMGNLNLTFDIYMGGKNKGAYYALKKTSGGYLLIDKNGTKYYFCAQYYSRNVEFVEHFPFNNQSRKSNADSRGYYLSYIEDTTGNNIQIKYERFGGGFDDGKREYSDIFKQREYSWELSYAPLRPSRIIDTYGREFMIHYRSKYNENDILDSQIDSISYFDTNGTKKVYQYVYGTENYNKDCLIEVIPPLGNSTVYNYIQKNESLPDEYEDNGDILTSTTYPTGAKVQYSYEWHNPVSIKPGMSEKDQQRFSGYRVTSRNLAGSQWSYGYSGEEEYNNYKDGSDRGRMWGATEASITDPLGQTISYKYKEGIIVRETNPAGHISDYNWDFAKRDLLSVKKNKGGATFYTEYVSYDEYGNPRGVEEYGLISDPYDDRSTHIEYLHEKSGTYRNKHIVDRVSHQWVTGRGGTMGDIYYDYDGGGRALVERKREATDTGYATTSYTYDISGNMLTSTDPNGNSTHYTYGNGSPLPTSISINAGGRALTLSKTYSSHTGALLTETDYNGNTSSYQYDTIGRLTRKTQPDRTTISYTYNDSNNTIDMRDEKGEETTYKYDNQGRLIEKLQPEYVTTKYSYDPLSHITKVTDAGGRSTNYSYDSIGRLTYLTYPDGLGTSLSYLDSQNSVDVSDANGNTTRYKYDGMGNLIEVTEANGVKTEYAYDCLGNIITIRDPRKLVTLYSYSLNGKLTLIKESDGSTASMNYDRAGNLKRREDGKGAVINYSYDEMSRLAEKRYSDSKYNVKYTYDEPSSANGLGKLTSVDDKIGKTIYSYDNIGRMISKLKTMDSKSYLAAYEYDPAGNLVKVTDPSGKSTSYTIDGLGRVTSVKRDIKDGQLAIAEYYYNPSGTIAGINFLNGVNTSYTYDTRDRIKRIKTVDQKGNILVQQDHAYDAVGNRISLTSKDEEDVRYEYDDLNRLIKVIYPKDSEEFKYDAAGNRTSLSHAFGKIEYVYDAASNKLTEAKINDHGKINYSHDGAGNQTKEQHYTGDAIVSEINYKYDPDNRLIEISKPINSISGADMPDDKSEYSYDESGMRIKKARNGEAKYYVYDLANQVLCEIGGSGSIESSYVYANAQRIAEVKPDGSILFSHNDALGSPVLITDKDAKEVQRYIYEPFGNIVVSKGTGDNNYTFTGKERDIESNLFYFGARYYNPILGRFISKDLANPDYEDPQSLNRYIYCLNNPLICVDIDGLDPRPITYFYNILRPGDIITAHSPGAASWAVRAFTRSYWNHVAIYVGNGQLVEMIPFKGIQKTNLLDTIASSSIVGIFRATQAPNQIIQKAINFSLNTAQDKIGYNWGAIFSLGLFRNKKMDKFVCSEHVWAAYSNAGLDLVKRDLLITPGEITGSLSLSRIDYNNQLLFNSYTGNAYMGWKSIGLYIGEGGSGLSFGWSF